MQDNCDLSQKFSIAITGGIKLQEAIYLIDLGEPPEGVRGD